ncbi:MAG: branched chain amino acid aminotransferase [Chloroflexi bacterium]|nr:branched chain amino acid aminotransferase [Chloroflexota bacterium]|tara:strand:- start:1127 stop:2053 length:927 start_codon:yes stop_codon:yes gene_type:complete
MPESLVHFKGNIVSVKDANVNIMTHALHYGTAVFEGIRGNWNEDEQRMFVFRMHEHYVRLLQGAKMLLMDIPYSADDLCEITIDLIKKSQYQQDLYIRPLVYKSEELVANLKLQELSSDFALMMVPFGAYLESDGALKCCTSSWRRVDDTIIPPRVKISGHYVNSILAKTEATLAGFDEAIMLTQDGYVSEGSGENLFLINQNTLITPPVADNNLTGITRDSAIKIAKEELGLQILERRIRRSELYFADEVFLTGTAAHIQSVGQLDNRNIGDGLPGKITSQINEVYQQAIRGNNRKYRNWCTEIEVK